MTVMKCVSETWIATWTIGKGRSCALDAKLSHGFHQCGQAHWKKSGWVDWMEISGANNVILSRDPTFHLEKGQLPDLIQA